MDSGSQNLLEVKDLRMRFRVPVVTRPVVEGVDLSISPGQTAALVGESGSGKTLTALAILRLLPRRAVDVLGGRVEFRDESGRRAVDLLKLDRRALRRVRGSRLSMVFQEPAAALNPVFSIGGQIVEALRLHRRLPVRTAWEHAARLLEKVGIADAPRRIRCYPYQLSGGMQQRVMIAIALACEPALLIADEPTSALDVTVQAQILTLLRKLQRDTGMAMLLITHDMGVAAHMADYVYVMHAGRIVERGAVGEVFARPRHACTRRLVQRTPVLSCAKGTTYA